LCITEVGGIGFSLFHVGILPSWTSLGRVDELFDDNPCGHEMN
jgi:hypothetical protein